VSAAAEQLPLLVELQEVYREAQRWADLVVVLNHHIATVADDDSRVPLELERVLVLTHELGTPNLAVEAAQAAVERYGAKPPLVAALADCLARVAVAASDADEAVTQWRATAAARRQLDDFAGAADALAAALARKPSEASLLAELTLLLGDLGQTARLHQALELHLGTLEGAARLPLIDQLVRVSEDLGDEAATQRWLAEARQLEPEAAARVNVRTLVDTIVPHKASVDPATLDRDIAAAEAELTATSPEDVTALRTLHERLGQLYRQAGRLGEAFAELSTVLADEPSNVAVLRALIDVAEADGRWLDAAQLLARSSQLLVEPGERVSLLYRAAELYLVRLGDRDSASDCYLKAVDLDPTHAPTLRRLIDYFWSQGDLDSVAEMARALDDRGDFTAAETSAGTRARAALAAALVGDLKSALRLGAALEDKKGVAALARAAVERSDDLDENRVVQAVRAVCGTTRARLDAVRARLGELSGSDARASALAARLAD
jgi:tetratricopeptide (TPR) repeat protein